MRCTPLVFRTSIHLCRNARAAQAELYATALQETHDGYEAGPEATDFQVQLAARVQQLAAQQRWVGWEFSGKCTRGRLVYVA